MRISIDKKTLTDGSHTYAVRLTRSESGPRSLDTMAFEAEDLKAAETMARGMAALLNEHSMDIVVFQGMSVQVERPSDDEHYLKSFKRRLEALYDLTKQPNRREQISDEISWIDEKLGIDR